MRGAKGFEREIKWNRDNSKHAGELRSRQGVWNLMRKIAAVNYRDLSNQDRKLSVRRVFLVSLFTAPNPRARCEIFDKGTTQSQTQSPVLPCRILALGR